MIEHHYPGGLSGTLFYPDWCRFALGMAMRGTIQGAASVYFGWNQSVDLNLAARAARYFWEGRSTGGSSPPPRSSLGG